MNTFALFAQQKSLPEVMTETQARKIGDGSTSWIGVPYFVSDVSYMDGHCEPPVLKQNCRNCGAPPRESVSRCEYCETVY